jgi:hypothetical protein
MNARRFIALQDGGQYGDDAIDQSPAVPVRNCG